VNHSRVIALPQVEGDLRAASRFYQSWRADGRAHLQSLWDAVVASISQNPELFPSRYLDFRRAPLRNSYYAAFYVIEPTATVVVAVLDRR
jgi:plasmid stabilization system protein ParE